MRYADYGYILENGRVMMDGAAADLAQNEDVKEFYLAFPAASARASATTSSIAAASAGWPSDTPKGGCAGASWRRRQRHRSTEHERVRSHVRSFSMSWKHERPSNASAS